MTDMTKYKNVSLSKETYSVLAKLSKVLMPDFPGGKLSIAKTIEYIANEKVHCKRKSKKTQWQIQKKLRENTSVLLVKVTVI
jgi:ribosomal protein S7